jgi:hypothetical protein
MDRVIIGAAAARIITILDARADIGKIARFFLFEAA